MGAMAEVRITEFTDPGCPWAWSGEPSRLKLRWLYGDHIEWHTAMVVLAESTDEFEEKGFTPERQAGAFASIAREHGMPIDASPRPRMAATVPACRAVVAVRLHSPEHEHDLLRRLRVHHFAGGLLDDPQMIAAAAADAGLDPQAVHTWMAEPEVERALREDMARARAPRPAARVLDSKLADWSGGRRYTCPSYEIERISDGTVVAIPGFQPFPVYEVTLANLIPDVQRRAAPETAEEVLAWASEPLASREVAVLRDISPFEARQELSRVAEEQHMGADGLWSAA